MDRSRFTAEAAIIQRGGGYDHEIPADVTTRVLADTAGLLGTLSFLGPLRCYGSLKRLIRATRPDAIIGFGSLFNGTVALAAHQAGFAGPVLVIQVIHQSSEVMTHRGPARWGRDLFLRWTFPLASAVVAVSQGVAADLRNRYGLTRRVHVIKNGIDLEEIRRLAREPVDDRFWPWKSGKNNIIVACGRLVRQKGFDILIEALREIPARVKLVLVGDGEERQALEELTISLALQRRVCIVGYDRNPYRYMAKADLFVMPSLWEGFAIVLVEALALRLPVVASDCPSGPREILCNGACGILVPPGHPRALAQAINRLLSDHSVQDTFRRAAKARAEQFSAAKSVSDYMELLDQLGK